MIIIRENTLTNTNLKEKKEGKNKPKEQNLPEFVINEIASTNRNKYQNVLFSFNSTKKMDGKYCKSRYNIQRTYPNDITILMNTASEAVIAMSKNELTIYDDINNMEDDSEFTDALRKLGVIVRQDFDEKFQIDILRNKYAYMDAESINLMIHPTLDCNAQCFYCFQQHELKSTMTEEIADKIIKYIADNLATKYELNYRWFGGEPLLADNIIDRIIKGVNREYKGNLKYNSVIFTNNSLISEKMIEKYFEDWHVRKINVTLDGYREEHNRRKAYIDKKVDAYRVSIDNIRLLLNKGYFVVCRINLDYKNIDQFKDILDDLVEFRNNDNFLIHATTLRNQCHSEEKASEIYIYPEDYDNFYSKIFDKLFEKGFFKDVVNILPLRLNCLCLACTTNGLVINADGKFYRCGQHAFDDENCVGDYETGIIYNNAYKKWYAFVNTLPTECPDCVFLPCCQGGCKHYRMENKPGTTPCLREKNYINVIFDTIYKQVFNGGYVFD